MRLCRREFAIGLEDAADHALRLGSLHLPHHPLEHPERPLGNCVEELLAIAEMVVKRGRADVEGRSESPHRQGSGGAEFLERGIQGCLTKALNIVKHSLTVLSNPAQVNSSYGGTIRLTSSSSFSERSQFGAAAFASACSGVVAPAITEETIGLDRSHENASSSSVWP